MTVGHPLATPRLQRMQASSAWSRALSPYEMQDISDDQAEEYLIEAGISQLCAEGLVRADSGGHALLMNAAASAAEHSQGQFCRPPMIRMQLRIPSPATPFMSSLHVVIFTPAVFSSSVLHLQLLSLPDGGVLVVICMLRVAKYAPSFRYAQKDYSERPRDASPPPPAMIFDQSTACPPVALGASMRSILLIKGLRLALDRTKKKSQLAPRGCSCGCASAMALNHAMGSKGSVATTTPEKSMRMRKNRAKLDPALEGGCRGVGSLEVFCAREEGRDRRCREAGECVKAASSRSEARIKQHSRAAHHTHARRNHAHRSQRT